MVKAIDIVCSDQPIVEKGLTSVRPQNIFFELHLTLEISFLIATRFRCLFRKLYYIIERFALITSK